jgi:hypothetical protein
MADIRKRGQPGTVPVSRRDHGAAGRDSLGVGDAGDGALDWPVTAMTGALRRLDAASAADVPQAVAAAIEAMWWVTVVDATMTRRYPAAYGRALAALDPAERRALERSFTGLRFIRSQLGYFADPGDFVQPAPGIRAVAWTWRSYPRRRSSAAQRGTRAPIANTGPSSPVGLSRKRSRGPPASSP